MTDRQPVRLMRNTAGKNSKKLCRYIKDHKFSFKVKGLFNYVFEGKAAQIKKIHIYLKGAVIL